HVLSRSGFHPDVSDAEQGEPYRRDIKGHARSRLDREQGRHDDEETHHEPVRQGSARHPGACGPEMAVGSCLSAPSFCGMQKIELAWDGRVVSGGRRVTGEDVVAILGRLVAGEASLVQRLVARFAIPEVGKSPAISRGVLL